MVRDVVAEFSPERVAPSTGVAADAIRRLAREFAAAESAVCYGRIGVSTQEFGGICQWLINVLNIVTGNLDRPGGACSRCRRLIRFRRRSRWRRVGVLDAGAAACVVYRSSGESCRWRRWRKRFLTDGPGQIKALVTHAGNPVLSTPNGRKLDRALASLDYMVLIDF